MKILNKKTTMITLLSVLMMGPGLAGAASKEDRIKSVILSEIQKIKTNSKTMQWSFEAGKQGRSVRSGSTYQLYNLQRNSSIVRHKRRLSKAADLGFSKKQHIKVKKRGGGAIRYGDVVALHLTNYGWLKYQNRGKAGGINLGAPKKGSIYTWKLTGGKAGDIIKTGNPFSLRNLANRGNYIKYCKRSFGIDLGWGGQSCGGVFPWVSNKIWGENGSQNVIGRFCNLAVASGRVYGTAKTLGLSESVLSKQIKWGLKRCK